MDCDQQDYSQPLVEHNQTHLMTFKIILDYIISDIYKNSRSFKIGLFTIYLVVTFLSLIQSAFSLSPLIFLQLAETTTGDTDIIFAPTPSENRSTSDSQQFGPPKNTSQLDQLVNFASYFNLINSSEIDQVMETMNDQIFGQSPRWLMLGSITNPNDDVVKISDEIRSYVLVIDSLKEISIGLGRRLETDIISNDEAIITTSSLRGLNVQVGEPVDLNIDIVALLSTYMPGGDSSGQSDQSAKQFFQGIFDENLNKPLKEIFGDDIMDREFDNNDLQDGVDQLREIADYLEQNPDVKEQAKDRIIDYINEQDTTQEQKDFFIEVVDRAYERNLTSDVDRMQEFVDRLPENQTITIAEVEDAFIEILIDTLDFKIPLIVRQGIESPRGKWADGLGNIIVLDYRNVTNLTINALLEQFDQVIADAKANDTGLIGAVAELIPVDEVHDFVQNNSANVNLSDYSISSNVVFTDRVDKYSSETNIKNAIIDVTNKFYRKVGYSYPASASVPLGTAITQFLLLKNFIDNLIVSATFLLLMLSVLLIYSLMIGDVEEKTYEFGMLRALGFKKHWLIILLTIQALVFAMPGLTLGLITSYILNSLVAMFIFDSSYLISTYQLAPSAVGLAFGMGLFIPIASNILPIMRALSKTLRDSLDLYHRSMNDILVTVIKLEKMGISLSQAGSALLLILMGFTSYYLIPMAFIFSNIQLALAVINIILIIMIIGFTLIVNLLEEPFEKLLLNLMLCIYKKDRNLKPVILKNMQGHYSRNWKTTLMYTLALAFLIFAGTGFALQTEVIGDLLQSNLGSDIAVMVLPTDKFGLDEYKIREFMEKTKVDDPSLLDEYSFSSYLINQIPGLPNHCWISTLSRFPWKKLRVAGVEENMLRSVMQQYYIPNDYDEGITFPELQDGQLDGVSGLFNREGNIDLETFSDSQKILGGALSRDSFYNDLNYSKPNQITVIDRELNLILPEGYKYEAAIDVNTPSLLYVGRHYFRLKIRHMATKVPGFAFSAYRSITSYGQGILSMEDILYILNDYYGGDIMKGDIPDPIVSQYFEQLPKNLTYGLPKDQMFIKFARATTKTERIDFANGLRNYFRNEQTLLFDVIQMRIDANDTFYFITLFYVIVALIAMILSFFLILVSFVSNVRENSWEFGVLRAVGLDKQQITRVYIYEAVSLITASGLLGTIIGLVVAITLTLQILMFTELPFHFAFPTEIFLITFLGGFVTAVFGSYLAVKEIRDKSIASILKGLI